MKRIALGTAQFGFSYGVANRRGQVTVAQISEILNSAQDSGVDTLDTAISYGSSEECLGQVGVKSWKVVTKLPGLPSHCSSVSGWIKQVLTTSLQRLRVDKLYGLLLHRPADLLGLHGNVIYDTIQELKEQGWIEKIGISVYGPEDLDHFYSCFPMEIVQAPLNILDRRMIASGWLDRFKQDGVEVHIRSIFLQGLLLLPPEQRPLKFAHWHSLWKDWDEWLVSTKVSPLEACLSFALNKPNIDRVLVGVDSLGQWQEIQMSVGKAILPAWPEYIQSNDLDLINPARWTL